jgi:hypothetical protein
MGFLISASRYKYSDGSLTLRALLPPTTFCTAQLLIMTFFDTLSRSYADVDTSNGIDTNQFLEASEGLVKMFGTLLLLLAFTSLPPIAHIRIQIYLDPALSPSCKVT